MKSYDEGIRPHVTRAKNSKTPETMKRRKYFAFHPSMIIYGSLVSIAASKKISARHLFLGVCPFVSV